jgi:hypothetical protein
MVRAAGLEVAVTRQGSAPKLRTAWPGAHRANNPYRTIRSSKPGIEANTAAANPFPDRGGGGYLGRSLTLALGSVSVMGNQPLASRVPLQ